MSTVLWRKSSSSDGGNTNCVEVAWRKSSFSSDGNSDCVEVAFGVVRVAVRDSKNSAGPVLAFPEGTWRVAVTRLPGGQPVPTICP